MRPKFTTFLCIASIAVLTIVWAGCYTQLSSSKDEDHGQGEEYTTKHNEYDNDSNRDYDSYDEDYNRAHQGFSYYHPSYGYGFPSTTFSAAYNDPWSFGMYGYYGGGYNSYGYNYYNPYNSYGYYSPYSYYSYYPSYYYRYGYTYATPGVHRVRTTGSTRGGSNDDGMINGGGYSPTPGRENPVGGGGALPTGASIDRPGVGSVSGGRTTDANVSRTRGGASTKNNGVQPKVRSNRGSGSRSGGSRYINRETRPAYVPNEGNTTSGQPPKDTDTRHERPSNTGTRETSTTRSSSPPPSTDSSPSRGGSSRGRRP